MIPLEQQCVSLELINWIGKSPGLAGDKTEACRTLLHPWSPHHRQGEYRGSKIIPQTNVFDGWIKAIYVTL
jgi:hypothetical protein